jgi:hypothetical protein
MSSDMDLQQSQGQTHDNGILATVSEVPVQGLRFNNLAAPEQRTAAPHLPHAAWKGLIGRYRDLVAPCTEAPEAFHLGAAIAAIGCLIGRKAWIVTPRKCFPNFYCMLVGKTGHTRKTTAYQYATDLLSDGGHLLEANAKQLNGLASVEGLAAAMQDAAKHETLRILSVEDEFRSLVTKSGQKAVSNIIPKLTELFNCPPSFEVNTRKAPINVPEPFLCMLTATTQAWFEESLTGTDVSGGFLNRWLLFEGAPGELLPFPPAIDTRAWEDLVQDICIAIHKAEGLFRFSVEAKDKYVRFYHTAHGRYLSEATSRVDFHAKKLALLYAILAGHQKIELDDIESGIAVAEYCATVVEPLAAGLDISPQKRLEDRILSHLREGSVRMRDGYRKLHVAAKDYSIAIRSLVEVGQVECAGGRYRLVDE